jgi:hypothetical protein
MLLKWQIVQKYQNQRKNNHLSIFSCFEKYDLCNKNIDITILKFWGAIIPKPKQGSQN